MIDIKHNSKIEDYSKTLLLTVCLLAVTGCDRIPRTVYEIETTDGKMLKLLCPTIDRDRSKLTYLIDGECVALLTTNPSRNRNECGVAE